MSPDSSLVYSTTSGRLCPDCHKPVALCPGHRKTNLPTTDGTVRVSLDTKGRKGKGVTVITGVPVKTIDELEALARRLKQKCGAGGTVKDGVVEIQGDHRDMLVDELSKQGYKVKRAGG